MSIVYLTTTNLDLTEGRGTNRPCLISAQLAGAIEQSERLGVMGTSSSVSIYEFDTAIDEPVDPGSNHSLYSSRKKVVGGYVDGTGWHRWGLIPDHIERLTQEEQTRLDVIRKQLGDDLPSRAEEPPVNDRAPRSRTALLVWSEYPASIATRTTRTGQIISIHCVSPRDVGYVNAHVDSLIKEIRKNGHEGTIYATWVEMGVPFRLRAEEADHIDDSLGQDEENREAARKTALLEEYTALARKAGIL